MTMVRLFADGSCLDNPGRGGWGYLLEAVNGRGKVFATRQESGYEPQSTNNRMELMAVIRGFEVLTQRCQVEVLTDSKYVTNGMGTWMKGWKARNWMTASKKPVQNKDLWLQLDKLVANHDVVFTWVAGGAHTNQQICHALAGDASSKQKATKEVKIL